METGAWLSLAACVLATQAEAPRTVGEVFRRGEEAVWVFEVDGKPIGEHASSYVGVVELSGGEAHLFRGQVRLESGPPLEVELQSTAELWTDDLGHPLRFVQHALVGEAYSSVEISVEGKGAKAVVVQGSSRRELPLEAVPQTYLLANNYLSHLELLLALREPAEDTAITLLSASTLKPFPYRLEVGEPCEGELDGRPVSGLEYRDSLGEHLRFAGGRLLAVELPAQKTVIRRVARAIEPLLIEPPESVRSRAAFDAEEVVIERDGARLAGTVTRPRPRGAQGERLPAVFFVSGSGPQDRDGFSSGIDLGTHEILDRLTADGFAVLRVDDRGAGASSALPAEITFEDLVADARAGLEHLLQRSDVDPARIALIGHSEGAVTVPILAAEFPAVAAIVLMAAPGRSIVEILAAQNRLALEQAGLSGEDLERKLSEVVRFLRRLAGGEEIDPASVAEDLAGSLPARAWIQSHARQDPLANLVRVQCPTLILHGETDFQVSAEHDARPLAAALDAKGHPDHELMIFPGLDHLFKRTPGERSQLADYVQERPVDPAFLDALSGWLTARLASPKH